MLILSVHYNHFVHLTNFPLTYPPYQGILGPPYKAPLQTQYQLARAGSAGVERGNGQTLERLRNLDGVVRHGVKPSQGCKTWGET